MVDAHLAGIANTLEAFFYRLSQKTEILSKSEGEILVEYSSAKGCKGEVQ